MVGNRTRVKVVKNKVAPAVQASRVRHHVRQGHQPRGWADRRRCGGGHRAQGRRLVHLRGRPARPGQGEPAPSCATTPTSPTRSRRRSSRSSASVRRSTRRRAGEPAGARGADRCRGLLTGLDRRSTSSSEGPEADPESVARTILLDQLTGRARSRKELSDKLRLPQRAATRSRPGCSTGSRRSGWSTTRRSPAPGSSQRQQGKGLARRALAQELRRKGVDDEVAREALDEVDPGDEAGGGPRAGAQEAAQPAQRRRDRPRPGGWSGCWPARATRPGWRSPWCARSWRRPRQSDTRCSVVYGIQARLIRRRPQGSSWCRPVVSSPRGPGCRTGHQILDAVLDIAGQDWRSAQPHPRPARPTTRH